MIVLDTYIWIWYAQGDPKLPETYKKVIEDNWHKGLGVCSISPWEIAKAVEHGKLNFPISLEEWFLRALAFPGIELLELTPKIAIESTCLPGDFHKDPSDQIIVATGRILDVCLITFDSKILKYPHVKLAQP